MATETTTRPVNLGRVGGTLAEQLAWLEAAQYDGEDSEQTRLVADGDPRAPP